MFDAAGNFTELLSQRVIENIFSSEHRVLEIEL